LVDVSLSAQGKTLKAHKVVLSACSEYFRDTLQVSPLSLPLALERHINLQGITSWQHPVVVLRDVPFSDLKGIVEFVYHGEVSVDQDELSSLLRTAQLLRVKGLTDEAATGAAVAAVQKRSQPLDKRPTSRTSTLLEGESRLSWRTGPLSSDAGQEEEIDDVEEEEEVDDEEEELVWTNKKANHEQLRSRPQPQPQPQPPQVSPLQVPPMAPHLPQHPFPLTAMPQALPPALQHQLQQLQPHPVPMPVPQPRLPHKDRLRKSANPKKKASQKLKPSPSLTPAKRETDEESEPGVFAGEIDDREEDEIAAVEQRQQQQQQQQQQHAVALAAAAAAAGSLDVNVMKQLMAANPFAAAAVAAVGNAGDKGVVGLTSGGGIVGNKEDEDVMGKRIIAVNVIIDFSSFQTRIGLCRYTSRLQCLRRQEVSPLVSPLMFSMLGTINVTLRYLKTSSRSVFTLIIQFLFVHILFVPFAFRLVSPHHDQRAPKGGGGMTAADGGVQRKTCPYCFQKLSWHALSRHIRDMHRNKAGYVNCRVCGKVFRNKNSLGCHMWRFHKEKRGNGNAGNAGNGPADASSPPAALLPPIPMPMIPVAEEIPSATEANG